MIFCYIRLYVVTQRNYVEEPVTDCQVDNEPIPHGPGVEGCGTFHVKTVENDDDDGG